MKSLQMKAYAKVNLALDVLRRRENGYHDVRMIMQNLDIYDELEFTVDEDTDKRHISITANREDIPTDERNLIHKAILLMFDEYDINASINVRLIKNIPVEAGMAGGSTDCAAALKAVNILFDLKLDEKKLMELGVRLGADVPFCIMARTALSEGIGEILTPMNSLPACYVLVAKPPVNVSTKMVYTNLRVNELERHPDISDMIKGLDSGNLELIANCMENVLETVTVNMYPEIENIKSIMKEYGALNAIMSGSGPTVFGLYTDKEKAAEASEYIQSQGYSKDVYVTMPI